MADALSDQLTAPQLGGAASAGLGGASAQISPTEDDSPIRFKRFTFTIPASGAGSANGDRIKMCKLNVFDRLLSAKVLVPAGGLGASTTLSIGKIDENNSSNTDNTHFSAAKSSAAAGVIDADTNLTEQVGVAPTGAVTDTGMGLPNFGSGPIDITVTIGGGTPTAAVKLYGWVTYVGSR